MTYRFWSALILSAVAIASGCAPTPERVAREGLQSPVAMQIAPGSYDGEPARRVLTRHYQIDTTIADEEFVGSLGQLMEGGLIQYRKLAPGVPLTDRPMLCNLFASRTQWAHFTREEAGPDARTYLQINRGGYTMRDRYVAYFIGDVGTWCVAAHEGWHQFVARHFQRRPPPFLEEGLACLFEDVQWQGQPALPTWNLSQNPGRLSGLRKTVDKQLLLPLWRLCSMHAGQVVNTSGEQIEGFYAQSWAFARFLWDADHARYRPALQRMLTDLATGTAPASEEAGDATGSWNPQSARPLLEHYLGQNLDEIDREYQAYIRRLVHGTEAAAG